MPDPENSFATVIKLSKREHDPGDEERHVRRCNNHVRATPIRFSPQFVHKILWVVHVLDQIHQQDLMIARHVGGNGRFGRKRNGGAPFRKLIRSKVYRGDMTQFLFQFSRHVAVADTELKDESTGNTRFHGERLRRGKT